MLPSLSPIPSASCGVWDCGCRHHHHNHPTLPRPYLQLEGHEVLDGVGALQRAGLHVCHLEEREGGVGLRHLGLLGVVAANVLLEPLRGNSGEGGRWGEMGHVSV